MPGVIVVGAGPGIGLSVAKRFAREGPPIGLIARSPATVTAALAALKGKGVETHGATTDAAEEVALRSALDELVGHLGVPEALIYNAAVIQEDAVGELSAERHLGAWAANVVGAVTAAAQLLSRMAEAGKGTYVMTGGMPEPVPEATSLSLGKAGVRALAELLDKRFGPSDVHVAMVTVGGVIAPGTAFDPDYIAELYWRLHMQRPHAWEREALLDGRTSSVRHRSRKDS